MAVPYFACMVLVAQIYALPPRVLPAIQRVEGGAPGVSSHNTDGTDDLGIMQINTIWLPILARISGTDEATAKDRLLDRPCYNIAAAGMIMRRYLDETHGDLMLAIGNYHSHTRLLNIGYQAKVMNSAAQLFAKAR
jgi:hypothetical protein